MANIFLGKITKWGDHAIKALNPDATLPSHGAIQTVHRSDSSGTTNAYTSYLAAVNADGAAGPARAKISSGSAAWAPRVTTVSQLSSSRPKVR